MFRKLVVNALPKYCRYIVKEVEIAQFEEKAIKLTPSCVQKMHDISMKKKLSLKDIHLRLSIGTGGCSGYQYIIELDYNKPKDDEIEVNIEDCSVIIDPNSFKFLSGCTIDFIDTIVKRGFEIAENPNSEKKCGCGKSFSPATPQF